MLKCAEQAPEAHRSRRDLERTAEEVAAQFLVRMAIDGEVNADTLHERPHVQHFGTAFEAWRKPTRG